jgi:hypothetical protein
MSDNVTEGSLLEVSETLSMGGIKNLFSRGETERMEALKETSEDETEEKTEEVEEDAQEEKVEESEVQADETPEEESEEETEEEVKVLEEPGEFSAKPKTFVLKQGDADFEVPNDAVIEIPVDGGIRKIHFQEMVNRASGDISIQERITEVEKERKIAQDLIAKREAVIAHKEREASAISETLNKVAKLATEGEPEDLLAYCARVAGKDPVDTLTKFLDDCIKWSDGFGNMDEQSKKVWIDSLKVRTKNQELSEKEAIISAKEKAEQDKIRQQEIGEFAGEVLTKAGVSDDELAAYIKDLKQKDIQLKAADDDIKGKLLEVLDYVHEDRVWRAANDTYPEMTKDIELLQGIYDYTAVRGIRKMEDIVKIVKAFADQEEKKEKDRIAENLSRKSPKEPTQKTSKANDESPVMNFYDFRKKTVGW